MASSGLLLTLLWVRLPCREGPQGRRREALPLAGPHTPGVGEEKMKEQSGGPSISLGMFRRPLTKKIKKSVYKMECQEHCVKEHLSGRL